MSHVTKTHAELATDKKAEITPSAHCNSMLQHTAQHCTNTLQHTATHCRKSREIQKRTLFQKKQTEEEKERERE